jgi:hypothetical protein
MVVEVLVVVTNLTNNNYYYYKKQKQGYPLKRPQTVQVLFLAFCEDMVALPNLVLPE